MTDPTRWSEAGEASELERELVRAGQAALLPDSERRALWASIALALPVAAPLPSAAPARAAATARWGASLTKGLVFVATVTGLTVGALQVLPRRESPRAAVSRSTPPLPPATPVVSAASISATDATLTPEPVATVQPVPSDAKPAPVSSSQLREESVALLAARAALRAGDAARSLALLEQARFRFPRGALGQEREALTIQALAQSGERASARRRADAFLRAHPQSPYVADVRLLATP